MPCGCSTKDLDQRSYEMKMRTRALTLLSAAAMMAVGAIGAAPVASAETPSQTIEALRANAADQAESEAAYAAYLASGSTPTCEMRNRQAAGHNQYDVRVGGVFARDAAEWSVECVDFADPPERFDLVMEISFEYWDSALLDYVEVPGSTVRCQQASNGGVATIPNCVNEFTYPWNHVAIGKTRRAHLHLLAPHEFHHYAQTTTPTCWTLSPAIGCPSMGVS